MSKQEYIEWCDFWFEDPENIQKPRVLLIGDSITRDYKGPVMELFRNRAAVNMMASSRGMDNEDYYYEMGHVLNQERFHYQAIHLNNGLHAKHLSEDEYEELLHKTVGFLQTNSTGAIIIALSTPVYRKETGYGNEENERVIKRNERAVKVARQYGLTVNDLYSLSYGREEIRLEDGLHYNPAGSRLQAEQVVKFLKNAMNMRE